MTLSDAAALAYLLIGFIIGLRISVKVAWDIQIQEQGSIAAAIQKGGMHWWETPGPLLTSCAALAAWPLVWLAVAKPKLLMPEPPQVRAYREEQALQEQERRSAQVKDRIAQLQREIEQMAANA